MEAIGTGNSLGERDAVDRWLRVVGVMVKTEEAELLVRMVSEPRMALQADISERRLELSKKIREAEERFEVEDKIGHLWATRVAALKEAYKIMGGIL